MYNIEKYKELKVDTNQLVAELLNENFKTECETVGPTNLEDIVESEVEFVPAKHGSNMDLGSTIQILTIASTFIKTAIDLYIAMKNKAERDLEETELLMGIVTKKEIFQKLDKHVQQRLIKSIVTKLKELK